MGGWKLRWRIMQTEKVKERFRRQREMLGLEPLPEDSLSSASEKDMESFIKEYDAELTKGAEVEIGEVEGGETIDEEAVEDRFMEEEPAKQPAKDQKLVL